MEHTLHVPKVISLTNLLPSDINVKGPTILSLGALSQYNPKNDRQKYVWKRLGVNNDFTVNELNYLIQQNKLPPFTLAYFPDADAQLHKKGPDDLKAIEEADKSIQQALNAYPTWEDAIQQATWIILGDSGQSYVKEEKDTSLIQLDTLLDSYSFWENKEKKGQLAIAINERMAYIYVNDSNISIEEIVSKLKREKRIQLIAWKEDETNYVVSPKSNQPFTFSQNGSIVDQYNQSWTINGDTSILDLTIKNQVDVQYNQYPDALARLHGALHAQQERVIIVDAHPSFEFITKYSHDHAGGGAHGSLHKVDSIVPLIVTGTDILPPSNRLVDLKKWILTLVSGS